MKGVTPGAPQTAPKRDYRAKVALLLALAAIGTLCLHNNLWWWPFPRKPKAPPANGEIVWNRECPSRVVGNDSDHVRMFECGTLYAPLDYTNKLNDTRQAEIAVIRYRAGGGETPRDKVLGSVILNPGGPGGSGLGFLARKGLANTTDHQLDGKYDLVSFDPRGIGYTWPKVQCFNDTSRFGFHSKAESNYGLPGHHGSRVMKHEIGYMLADMDLIADVCLENPNSELYAYVSTPFVVRDMQLLHRALGDPKINYWGFSYGTVLGSTYAAMFPNDINRMAIDGVVDVYNYYEGLWSDNMINTEDEFSGFFSECVKSGVENCQLASLVVDVEKKEENKDQKQGDQLKQYVLDWANKLKINPIPVPNADPPRLLTYGDVFGKFFGAMYSPAQWPGLADSLFDAIHHGNHSALLDTIDLHPKMNIESEAHYAIACGDAHNEPLGPKDRWGIKEFEKVWNLSYSDSPNFSIYFAEIASMCQGSWPIRGVERFSGKFETNTSFPLLLLGNEYDPVTPGKYADKMAKRFEGSVSVKREGYGHCSSSQPSKCIDNVILNYFVNGDLPVPYTFCKVDEGPFDNKEKRTSVSEFLWRPKF